MVDRTGVTCVFGLLVDQRAGEFLAMIAFVFVEPSSAIGHFQAGFTDQVPVFRELAVESFVSTRVEGNIRCGRFSGGIRGIFCIDILVDLEGVVCGISEKFFQAIGPLAHEGFEGRQSRFYIRGFGREDLFIDESRSVCCGFHEGGVFGPPKVPDFGVSLCIFFTGNRFCSQRALWEAFDGSGCIETIVDPLFEVILFDPGENSGFNRRLYLPATRIQQRFQTV